MEGMATGGGVIRTRRSLVEILEANRARIFGYNAFLLPDGVFWIADCSGTGPLLGGDDEILPVHHVPSRYEILVPLLRSVPPAHYPLVGGFIFLGGGGATVYNLSTCRGSMPSEPGLELLKCFSMIISSTGRFNE